MTNNMRTITVAFDANRLPLMALTHVMGAMSMLQELAEQCPPDMLMLNEVMHTDEALSRLPKTRSRTQEASTQGRAPTMTHSPAVAETGQHDLLHAIQKRGTVSPEPIAASLTEGQQMLLDKMREIGKEMTRAEIGECMPDKRGNAIGTWLHGLETKGLVVSIPNGDVTTYKATASEMA